ncbi:MAG: ATP-binding protein [Bacteroidales bacterium]|nr:ATP-binding protein [Bacteroidales bacterium]
MQTDIGLLEDIFLDTLKSSKEKYKEALNLKDKGIILFVSHRDSLIFWSHNTVLFTNAVLLNDSNRMIKSDNGWFLKKVKEQDDWIFTALLLIKNEYNYENKFLENNLNTDLGMNFDKIKLLFDNSEPLVKDLSENYLFSLEVEDSHVLSEAEQIIIFVLFLILLYLLIFTLGKIFNKFVLRGRSIIIGFVFQTSILLIFRWLMFEFKWPDFIYSLEIFSPKYFASSELLPSLGDLTLNTFFLFIIVYLGCYKSVTESNAHETKFRLFSLIVVYTLAMIFCYALIIFIIKSLVVDSNIYLLFNNFYEITVLSIVSIGLIAILFFVYYFIIRSFIQQFYRFNKSYLLYFLISLVISFIQFFIIKEVWLSVFFLIVLLLSGYYGYKKVNFFSKTVYIMLFILIFAIITTYQINKNAHEKEKNIRTLFAVNLSFDKDPLAEFLFIDIADRLPLDSVLITLAKDHVKNEEELKKHLKKNYFSEYLDKYEMQLTICDSDDKLFLKPGNIEVNCRSFFDEMITTYGKPTGTPYFYQLQYTSGQNAYLVDFPIYYAENNSHKSFYIELFSKFIPKELGYPELLIDKNVRINTTAFDYNYARYLNSQLIQQFGQYAYFTDINDYKSDSSSLFFFDQNAYSHLYYRADDNIELIISKKKTSAIDYFAGLSFIFFLFSIVWFIIKIVLLQNLSFSKSMFNFSNRVKFAMVFIVIISFVVIGVVTLRYIITTYNNKNNDVLSEKAHSILIELENKLIQAEEISPDMQDYVKDLLVKFSNIFFTDINMYDISGNLIASSREKIFDEGLVSRKMNSSAYYHMTFERKTFFAHNENIGGLNYLSAYIPFRNFEDKTIAYVNLPYFAKESDQRREIASFLAAFINIYILLILLSIGVALLLSNYVSKPLYMIREKLSHFELGKSNEKIKWTKEDEIGSLVSEYNRLIDELSDSATKLAQSERESAWREMAKQVAHEIKNPLTPMKLSVQHLLKTWHNKSDDFDDRIEKFCKMMTDQIDTLSDIAGSFSDFANMPVAHNKSIDLKDILTDVALFYENIVETEISLVIDKSKRYIITADEKQLKRALSNLVKNALQATEKVNHPKIEIGLSETESEYVVYVKDNGIGVPKELALKIFTPSFTTKNSGMGLGLAIVKSITESFNGKVYFESQENEGSCFYLAFKR